MAKNVDYIYDPIVEGVALPGMVKADTETLRLLTGVSAPLPPIANVGSDPLAGYSMKAIDAAAKAFAMGQAFDLTKQELARRREISKLEEKAIEKYFRTLGRENAKRLGYLSRNQTQNENRFIKRFAADLLGVDNNLYKIIG